METKAFHVDVKIDDGGDEYGPYGGFVAMISDPSLDRDGERIMKGAFDPLPSRVPIDINHSRDVMDTIGSAELFYRGDQTWAKASFASTEKAQQVRQLMREGHITGVSVMFVGAQRGKAMEDGSVPIHKASLVKFGVVDVPANPNAHALTVKTSDAVEVVDLTVDPASETEVDIVATALQVPRSDVEALSATVVSTLAAVATAMGDNAARQAYRATGKTPGKAAPTPPPAQSEARYTLAEAREALAKELASDRQRKLLDVVTDPDVVAANLGPAAMRKQLYASLVNELADNIVLVRVPDGISYQKAAAVAQAAVDVLDPETTETPVQAPPAPAPSPVDAAEAQVLAATRAEVIANRDLAAALVARLQGLTSR